MAVTRRGHIFGAFLLSVLSVLLILIAVSSDSWVVSSATTDAQIQDSTIRYGLFGGSLVLYNLATPTSNTLFRTCNEAGMAAESAENLKRRKYGNLDSGHLFVPFGVETLGPWGPSAHSLYKDLAKRLVEATRDQNAGLYFAQRISIAIQRGNAASILGTLPTVTCVISESACALSCKTEERARKIEVDALSRGYRPTAACVAVTDVDTSNPLSIPPVISFVFYVCVLLILFLQLAFAVISAGLAITNATRNPTEPIFGLPGCLWANIVTALLGTTAILLFGIYWATSGLNEHLAVSYIALGHFTASGQGLGFSYWLLLCSILCNLCNVGLIKLRAYLLERDPPPPTIKVENHSDGTIFLY